MIKNTITFVFLLIFSSNYFSQTIVSTPILVEVYYGYPNLMLNYEKAGYSSIFPTTDLIKGKGFGPIGFRTEYRVSDKIEFGMDVNYNEVKTSFFADSLNSDYSVHSTYTVNETYKRLRIQLRINYYILEGDQFVFYLGFGAGSNTKSYLQNSEFNRFNTSQKNIQAIPFSLRICLGMRLFFTEKIGFHTEFGIGGPLLSTGLSFNL